MSPKNDQKSIKNQSKIDLNLGRHLDIDFSSIFFDFQGQDGAMLTPGKQLDTLLEASRSVLSRLEASGGVRGQAAPEKGRGVFGKFFIEDRGQYANLNIDRNLAKVLLSI